MTDHGRSKYKRTVNCLETPYSSIVDVYSVLVAFNVTCPARAHAVKKLLCAGIRGKGDSLQDLEETKVAVERAIQLEYERIKAQQRQGKQETDTRPIDTRPGDEVEWEVYPVFDQDEVNIVGYRVGWPCDNGSFFLVRHYMAAEKSSDGPSLNWCKHVAERDAERFNKEGKRPSEFPGWGNHGLETKSNV